jgi:hypothetical protein
MLTKFLNRLKSRVAAWVFGDEEMVYTTRGYLPIKSLGHRAVWIDHPHNIECAEEFFDLKTGEVVKRTPHIYMKRGQEVGAEQGHVS